MVAKHLFLDYAVNNKYMFVRFFLSVSFREHIFELSVAKTSPDRNIPRRPRHSDATAEPWWRPCHSGVAASADI